MNDHDGGDDPRPSQQPCFLLQIEDFDPGMFPDTDSTPFTQSCPPSPSSHTSIAPNDFSLSLFQVPEQPTGGYGLIQPTSADLLGIGSGSQVPDSSHIPELSGCIPSSLPSPQPISLQIPHTISRNTGQLKDMLHKVVEVAHGAIQQSTSLDQVREVQDLFKNTFAGINWMAHGRIKSLNPPAPPSPSNESTGSGTTSYLCRLCSPSKMGHYKTRGAFSRHVSHKHQPRFKYRCFYRACSWSGSRRDKTHEHLRSKHRRFGLSRTDIDRIESPVSPPSECGICSTPVSSWGDYFRCVCSHCKVPEDDATDSNGSSSRRGSGGDGGDGYGQPPDSGLSGGNQSFQNGGYDGSQGNGSSFFSSSFSFTSKGAGSYTDAEHSPMDVPSTIGSGVHSSLDLDPSYSPHVDGSSALSPLETDPGHQRGIPLLRPNPTIPRALPDASRFPVTPPRVDKKHSKKSGPDDSKGSSTRMCTSCRHSIGNCPRCMSINQNGLSCHVCGNNNQTSEIQTPYPSQSYDRHQSFNSDGMQNGSQLLSPDNGLNQTPRFLSPQVGSFNDHAAGSTPEGALSYFYRHTENFNQWMTGSGHSPWQDSLNRVSDAFPNGNTEGLTPSDAVGLTSDVSDPFGSGAVIALPIRIRTPVISDPGLKVSPGILPPSGPLALFDELSLNRTAILPCESTHKELSLQKCSMKGPTDNFLFSESYSRAATLARKTYHAPQSSACVKKNAATLAMDLASRVDNVCRQSRRERHASLRPLLKVIIKLLKLRSNASHNHPATENATDTFAILDPKLEPESFQVSFDPNVFSCHWILPDLLHFFIAKQRLIGGLDYSESPLIGLEGDDDLQLQFSMTFLVYLLTILFGPHVPQIFDGMMFS